MEIVEHPRNVLGPFGPGMLEHPEVVPAIGEVAMDIRLLNDLEPEAVPPKPQTLPQV
jgi:hypothetical protein